MTAPHPIYDVPIHTLDGRATTLAEHRGKVLLMINVASHCGYTPQYTGLEALHRKFSPRGFSCLGFPCNQFGEQEPGDAKEIASFCGLTYDVTFPIYEKIKVNGPRAHPIWEHLKRAKRGFLFTTGIKWNFTKFLVGRDGKVIRRFGTRVVPEDIEAFIERSL